MLYCVKMQITLPDNLDPAVFAEIRTREIARTTEIQEQGKLINLWRIAGHTASLSIFDVEGNDELHEILSSLPLFPYMDIEITPLARHPVSISK